MSLSADGTTVAIGGPQNAGSNGRNSGHVRVYRLAPSVSSVTVTGAVTVTYTLVPGTGDTDNAGFWISPNDELRTTTGFNDERKASYAIRIRATDAAGAFVERTFLIAVGDVDEAPAIDHLIGPANGVYRAGQPLVFTAVLTQPVTRVGGGPISLAMLVGHTRQEATLVGGLGTNRLTFRYVVKAGMNDADGVSLHRDLSLPRGVFLRDSQGRRLSSGVPVLPAGVLVDTAAPVIRSLARPVDGTYRPGDALVFTAVMSERVTVTGTPAVELTFGAARRLATYVAGSGTHTLTFRYVVQVGDRAPWGIRITPRLALAYAAITDKAGNAVVPTFSLPLGFRIGVPLGIVLTPNDRQAAFARLR